MAGSGLPADELRECQGYVQLPCDDRRSELPSLKSVDDTISPRNVNVCHAGLA